MSGILLILTVFAFAGAIYFVKEQSDTREKFIYSCVEYANENNKKLLFTNKKHEAVIIIDEQSFTIPDYEISIIQDKEGEVYLCRIRRKENDMIKKLKGKDLKGKVLVKILSEDLIMRGFQYTLGKNVDINTLSGADDCAKGLHFCETKDVINYLDCGTKLAIVHVDDKEDVVRYDNKYRSHVLYIDEIMGLSDVKTWDWLVEQNVNIHSHDNWTLCHAAYNGYLDVTKYLVEQGADVHADGDWALRYAAYNGYFDIVKYLVEQGADIHAGNEYALYLSVSKGYLEIVKYFVEHGANIHVCNDWALRYAIKNGYSEVAKYLKSLS